MATESQDKKSSLQRLIELGTTQIILDPRREGVRVPQHLAHQPLLRLNVSPRFPNSDLKINWWGVRQTLTFQELRFQCQVPWEAVFAMGDPRDPEKLSFWTDAVPPELDELFRASLPETRGAQKPPPRPPRDVDGDASRDPRVTRAFTPRVIEGGDAPVQAPAAEGPEDDPPEPPRPFVLKLVK